MAADRTFARLLDYSLRDYVPPLRRFQRGAELKDIAAAPSAPPTPRPPPPDSGLSHDVEVFTRYHGIDRSEAQNPVPATGGSLFRRFASKLPWVSGKVRDVRPRNGEPRRHGSVYRVWSDRLS